MNNNGGGGLAGLLLPLLLLGFLAFVFLSQRRRKTAIATVQSQLRPGMSVLTTAGLFATVEAVEDEAVSLEIAPGVVCRFARAAIARVLDPPVDEPMGPEDGPPAAPAT